ncbi:MAG TPA: flagellar hook-associated protein FlgL [Alcaligenes sp.]|nr:flagellar hook-associated protein FlgL [Alcaligenes sp.]HRL25936.1 flagellar hook-associated protein FlgL [Alcaligenes sp.]
MRISSSLFFQTGLNSINKQQSDLVRIFQQIGSGQRMVTPSDDPLAAAQTIDLAQSQAMNLRYGENREVAKRSLSESENILNSVTQQLVDVRTRLVEASNGTLSDADRNTLATVMESALDTLLGYANAKDGSGQYLFSGAKGTTQPFDATYNYLGDSHPRHIQVEQTRQLDSANTGLDVFARANPGSTAYTTTVGASNTGMAVISGPDGSSTVEGAFTSYTITFGPVDPATSQQTYSIQGVGYVGNPATAPAMPVTGSFTPSEKGQRIALPGGVSFQIEGTPANGDTAQINAVSNNSSEMNLFGTLSSVVTALRTPSDQSPVGKVALRNVMNSAIQRVSENYNNVLTVRSSVGTRLNEIDALSANGALRSINYRQELSRLEDVDYYQASTQLQLRKSALEAAAMAFQKIQSTNLFSLNSK